MLLEYHLQNRVQLRYTVRLEPQTSTSRLGTTSGVVQGCSGFLWRMISIFNACFKKNLDVYCLCDNTDCHTVESLTKIRKAPKKKCFNWVSGVGRYLEFSTFLDVFRTYWIAPASNDVSTVPEATIPRTRHQSCWPATRFQWTVLKWLLSQRNCPTLWSLLDGMRCKET